MSIPWPPSDDDIQRMIDAVFEPSWFYIMCTEHISEAEAKQRVEDYWKERDRLRAERK